MLGDLIFGNPRFVAPAHIDALLATEHGLLALCSNTLVLFDVETGEVRSSLPLETRFYRGSLRRGGNRIVVGVMGELGGQLATCRIEDAQLVDLQLHELGVDEEESYLSALAANADAIHVGLSSRRLVVDWNGSLIESFPGPLEGPENRVGIDATGRAVWGDDSRTCIDGLELPRGPAHDAPFAFDGDRLVVASLQYSRVMLALFDLSTKSTEPILEMDHFGVGDVSEMTFVDSLLLLQSSRCMVAFDLDRGDVAWADSLNGPSGAMAVSGDTLFVARGHRVHRRSLATGERLDAHEGASHPIVEIVGDGRDVLARDGHRVYAIHEGAIVAEHDAWSVHEVDGRLWMLGRRGTLARFHAGRVIPMCQLHIGNGTATMVEIRDREAIVPDPNEREAPKLVRITGEEIARIGDTDTMRAWFFGDAFLVHHSKYDDDYERTQGFAVIDREGAYRWRNVDEAKELGVLGVDQDGRGFVIRREGEAQLIDSNGEVVGSFGEFPRYIDAPAVLFALSFVVLLKPNGELCRMPIAGGEHEVVHRFEEPPTALWADGARGFVAFGVREIRELDLSATLGEPRARFVFPLEQILETSDAELAGTLESTSFRGFDPEEHLEPLRARLVKVPVGDAHRAFAAKLIERGARVLHRHAHESTVVSFGLSPDGEHFATGSWVGEEYERGGTLQVWNTRTGKVVKTIDPVTGGVGWPGYGRCLKWSPDGSEIGAAIDTNGIVSFPPFGEGMASRLTAYVTNGGNRPPHYTWSTSGDRVAISVWNPPSLLSAFVVRTDAGVVSDQNRKWREVSPDPSEALSEIHNAPHHLQFSNDDSLLMFANNHHEAWSVDVESGALHGFVRYQAPMSYSPDGRFFVHAASGTSVHASTGEVLQTGLTPTDPDFVLWGPSHLAVHAGKSLHVFAPGLEPVATLDTSFGTSARRYDFTDAELAEWSPDGTQLAFVEDVGRIAVWTPADGTKLAIEVDPNVAGVLWRGDLLFALAQSACEVFDASADFARIRRIDFSCKHEMLPDTPSPLEVDGEDLAATLRPSPTFPVGESWGMAFPDGLVVCADAEALEDELSFVVDGRYTLPTSWAIRVRSTVAEATDELPFAPEIRGKLGGTQVEDVLPLGSSASLEEVSDLHWEIVQGLSQGWQTHASEALHLFATLHAHRGDAELAAREVRRIAEPGERVVASADVAYRIASTDRPLALELCAEAEERLGQSGQRQRQLASLAAAKHALGMPDAPALLAQAHDDEWLKGEANPFQNYAWLARAYLRSEREDEAWDLLEAGPESHGMLASFVERYIVHAARDGFVDHALRLARRCVERFESRGTSFSVIDAISTALSEAGRYDEALAYLHEQQGHSTTMYEERVRMARGGVGDLLERAMSATWPPDIALAIRDLTRGGAGQDVVSKLLERLLEQMPDSKMSRQSLPEMVESLAEGLARVGLASSSDTLLQSFSSDQARLALCRGVLRGSNDAYAEARLDEARELARKVEPRSRAEALVHVASALREHRPDDSRALIDEALESIAELRGDERRFGLSEVTRVLLGAGEHEAAYTAWKKQSKANRGYEVQPLIRSLARAGELGAALHVLRRLPRRDDMNGVPQHLRVVAEIYVHGDVVW